MKRYAIALCALLPQLAMGATLYLPLNLSPDLERRVERLLILANRPVMTRPIPIDAIVEAMSAGCAVDPVLCRQVQDGIAPWLGRAALGHASAGLALHSDASNFSQQNLRGIPLEASWQAAMAAYARLGSGIVINGGATAYAGEINPTGSFISVGGGRMQLDAGYRDHWWSPMHDSSMLLSTEAPTIASVTLSNSAPLTRVRLRYEVFGGVLSRSERILDPDRLGVSPGRPRLAGLHASLEPVPGWTIGGSRLIEFGGGKRSVSARQLFNLLFTGTRSDNTGKPTEVGNQQVSITSQLLIPGAMPMAVYMEYAAEDTFHSENFRFGNGALSAGLYLPRLRPNLQMRYEFSNWEDVWYVHHIYGDGMTNEGHGLGNWSADWRRRDDFVGGQSHMLALDWELEGNAAFSVRYRTLQNDSYTDGDYRRMHELSLSLSAPWRRFRLSTDLQGGRDVYGKGYGRVAATLILTGDARNSVRARESSAADADRATAATPTIERFVDLGVTSGRLRYEQDVVFLPAQVSDEQGAHMGLGVRRAYGKRSDFGARIEIDQLRGHALISLRALDYRYRMGANWAASAFFGFSRYDARTPAHGYYAGLGVQRRNVLPGWDVGLDLRYVDRVVRKKIKPGETIITWPNEFWSMKGAALYLSRRF